VPRSGRSRILRFGLRCAVATHGDRGVARATGLSADHHLTREIVVGGDTQVGLAL
jgi:hypothetical protein